MTGVLVTPRNAVVTPRCVEDAAVQATVGSKNKASDAHRVRTSHQSTSTPPPSSDHRKPDEFQDALLDYAMRCNQPQRHGQSSPMQPTYVALSTFLLLLLCLTACRPTCPAPVSWYEQTLEDEAYDKGESTSRRQLGSRVMPAASPSAYTVSSSKTRALNREIAKIYRGHRRTAQDQRNSSEDSVPESSAVPACPFTWTTVNYPLFRLGSYFSRRGQECPLGRRVIKIALGHLQTQQNQHGSSEGSAAESCAVPAGPSL